MKSIAIDMDGVLADTDSHFINLYYEAYGIRVPYEQLLGKPEGEGFPEKDAIGKFVRKPGFFRTLPVMPGAVDAVIELMKDFEVYIVSAAMEFPNSLSEKYEWLQQYFPFISWTNIVFCGDKGVINTDYMIDDHPKNLDKFKGKTIMFNCSHNANVNHHQRVNSWVEVLDLLKHAN
jgi:5'-nucleotidase